jgi:hypothetical protein
MAMVAGVSACTIPNVAAASTTTANTLFMDFMERPPLFFDDPGRAQF